MVKMRPVIRKILLKDIERGYYIGFLEQVYYVYNLINKERFIELKKEISNLFDSIIEGKYDLEEEDNVLNKLEEKLKKIIKE